MDFLYNPGKSENPKKGPSSLHKINEIKGYREIDQKVFQLTSAGGHVQFGEVPVDIPSDQGKAIKGQEKDRD